MCVDLVGRNNLVVVETRAGLRLQLIDTGYLYLDDPERTRPAVAREARRRIDRLKHLERTLAGWLASRPVHRPSTGSHA